MELQEYLKIQVERAFEIGRNQQKKSPLDRRELRDKTLFCQRNGYFPLVWEAYKAGLFAREVGD